MSESVDNPYQTIIAHLSELKNYIGKELGLTEWVQITQDMINQFGELTGDTQWIHTDVEKSKKYSPFKTTVAHGFMILSMASRFCYETCTISDITMGLNYGLDKVRVPNATPVGSFIRGRVSLKEVEEFEGGAKYKLDIIFEIKGEEKPAIVAEFIAMGFTDPSS